MKAVVFYENNPGIGMEEIMLVFPKHEEVERTFVAAGRVIGIGPFAIPGEGAMGIFKDRESAEQFVQQDPFVLEGLVRYTIKDWHDDMENHEI
ncbi:YciI family protein [Chryseobacterium sp. MFBS3-17]|uniref:YciI family protein n=1 Tax=Chryseobacterium sp. MFBS3-17 TaxID=2886689 RepID=UPI001D0E586E|nr:hypothetical protein [Chryseobacterium sp. MFBS3-17]MCC2591021.1 hypothetical protein [Chryseobacterium sp. MFBS3-17]